MATLIGVYEPAAAKLDAHVLAESAVSHYVKVIFISESASTTSYDRLLSMISSLGLALDYPVCAPYDASEPQRRQPRAESNWLRSLSHSFYHDPYTAGVGY